MVQSTVSVRANQCDRENAAEIANIDKTAIIGLGSFKHVFGGLYVDGLRAGELCVAKEIKAGPVELEEMFWDELHACTTAANLIDKFNKLQVVDKPIKLNRPEVWQYCSNSKLILIEPYIEKFEKFNSNTGWVGADAGPWSKVLQAMSHFSYHASGGACVLCDLQGAVYDEFVVLTDPVIMSRTAEFGPSDMGTDGIKTFFARHKCNEFCDKKWNAPTGQHEHFPMRKGSSARTADGKVIDPETMAQNLQSIPGGVKAKHAGSTKAKSPSPSIKSEKMQSLLNASGSRQGSVSLESAAKEKKTLTVLRQNLSDSGSNKRTWRAVKKKS